MTPGGERLFGEFNPFYGKTHTQEVLDKLAALSRQRTGEKNHFYGKKTH